VSEHDFEPIRGLPGDLPADEKLIWQGAPDAWELAVSAFHIRTVAAYFAGMLALRLVTSVSGGQAVGSALMQTLSVLPVALAALAMLGGLAWLYARTTVYTITSKRVVVRFGVALPKAINIPFAQIEGASVKRLSGGRGDVALRLKAPNKIAFLQLWPNARPWSFSSPEPTLRALKDVEPAAANLIAAMREVAAIDVAPTRTAPVRTTGASPVRPEAAAA
jgi:hypothetical protein